MAVLNRLIIIILIIVLQLKAADVSCKICLLCNSCSTDLLSDTYLDQIDVLLKEKFDNLKFPNYISKKNINSTNVRYQMQYNNNLTLSLSLNTQSGKISILSYSNSNKIFVQHNQNSLNDFVENTSDTNKNKNMNQTLNQELNQTKSLNQTKRIGVLFYQSPFFNFQKLKNYQVASQRQQLISDFLNRKYFANLTEANIKLVSFKTYGSFSRLIYFVRNGNQNKVFQIIVNTNANNTIINIISFTQITSSIQILSNSLYYDAEKIYDLSNKQLESLQNNQTKISNQLKTTDTASNEQKSQFYSQIFSKNSVQVKSLQNYLKSLFYKTYSKLILIKIESQSILKQTTSFKQFTSFRLTYKVKKFQQSVQQQPLFYQLIVTKTKSQITQNYDIVSALYINLLPLEQVYLGLFRKGLNQNQTKNDQNLPFIDSIIIKQFESKLGSSPKVIQIYRHQPYYSLSYMDLQKNVITFTLLYDVLLNNIQFYKDSNFRNNSSQNQNLTVSVNKENINNGKPVAQNSNTNMQTIQPNKSNLNISKAQIDQKNKTSNNIQKIPLPDSTIITTNNFLNNSNNSINSINSNSEKLETSLLYLSPKVNLSNGQMNLSTNSSSLINYSRFRIIQNISSNNVVVQIANFILQKYGSQINNFMRINSVYSYQNYYRFVFEIRRFQTIANNQIIFYEIILEFSDQVIKVISTQYLNKYIHQLTPSDLIQKVSFNSSNISLDFYFQYLKGLILNCSVFYQNQTINLKRLIQDSVLKSVGRYLPFYILTYSNGIGIIAYYDVLIKNIQILFINKANSKNSDTSVNSANSISQATFANPVKPTKYVNFDNLTNSTYSTNYLCNSSKDNSQLKRSQTSFSQKDSVDQNILKERNYNQVVNKQTESTKNNSENGINSVSNLSQNNVNQNLNIKLTNSNSKTFGSIDHTSVLQSVSKLSFQQINNQSAKNISSLSKTNVFDNRINSPQNKTTNISYSLAQKNNLISRNDQTHPNISKLNVTKQIGIAINNLKIFSEVPTQISINFWKKINFKLTQKNIYSPLKIQRKLLDYNRLKNIDYSQPLMLSFKSCTSNSYFSQIQVNYDLLSKVITYCLLKENVLLSSKDVNSTKLLIILQNIFQTYKRFVFMIDNSQITYQIIVTNEFILLSFKRIASLYQMTSDPYSRQFNISLSFETQMEKFQSIKTYNSIIAELVSVQVNSFKSIRFQLLDHAYKYIFSYLCNEANTTSLIRFVTEVIVDIARQQIQLISHKKISELNKISKIDTNIIGGSKKQISFFQSQESKKQVQSLIDSLIKIQMSQIFAGSCWDTNILQLYTSNNPQFLVYSIRYQHCQQLIEISFQGKYNLLYEYVAVNKFKKFNNGFKTSTLSKNQLLNVTQDISFVLNKAKYITNSLFPEFKNAQYIPEFIMTKSLSKHQDIYSLFYNSPLLYKISFNTKNNSFLSVSYITDLQNGQYFDQNILLGFRQIKIPQLKFQQSYNKFVLPSLTQFYQLAKSTILAVYYKYSDQMLSYLSIYQYNSQPLIIQTVVNTSTYQTISNYNKNINISIQGIFSKNCKSKNIQGLCVVCNNLINVNYQLANGKCYQTISNCKNQLAYKCYSCIQPYQLINNTCKSISKIIKSQLNSRTKVNYLQNQLVLNCIEIDKSTSKCIKCKDNFYLNVFGKCQSKQTQCITYDKITGICLICKIGYKFNSNNSLCQKQNGPCKTFNTLGQCCQCPGFQKYILFDGKCYQKNSNSINSMLPNQIQQIVKNNNLCEKWFKNKCYSCLFGSVLNNKGVCYISSQNCVSFDYKNQKCDICSRQFTNINGRCANNY